MQDVRAIWPDGDGAGLWSTSTPESSGEYAALLVDYPVLLRTVRALDEDGIPDLSRLVMRARELSPLLVARAYGAWYDADEASAAFSAGIDPTFVPPTGPASAPTATTLVADGMMLLYERPLDRLILCGDDRLLPLVAAARAEGVRVALLAHAARAGGPCARLADLVEGPANFMRTPTRAERYRRGVAAVMARGA